MSLAIPSYWREFREQFQLLHTEVEIPEEYDLSGVGADIEFYDDDTIVDSMTDSYPECIVNKDGFLLVGGCQAGSGDPYFINTSEGVGGKLYQIYHDMVSGAREKMISPRKLSSLCEPTLGCGYWNFLKPSRRLSRFLLSIGNFLELLRLTDRTTHYTWP